MLAGLWSVSGLAGSLMLNLEGVFTLVLAITAFGDSIHRAELGGALLVIAGAALLAFDVGGAWTATPVGAASIAAACLAWGIDNNLTPRISLRDPVRIVQIKTLTAGFVNLCIARGIGQSLPVRIIPAAFALDS